MSEWFSSKSGKATIAETTIFFKWLNLYFFVHEDIKKALKSSSIHYRSLFTTLNTDRHLLRQKVHQRISVMKTHMFRENCHFNSRFIIKTTKTSVLFFITEILWRTFWRCKKTPLLIFSTANRRKISLNLIFCSILQWLTAVEWIWIDQVYLTCKCWNADLCQMFGTVWVLFFSMSSSRISCIESKDLGCFLSCPVVQIQIYYRCRFL